ncbi:MAG: polysaccharide deacetylase family protein [Actinomycetota bacterium]
MENSDLPRRAFLGAAGAAAVALLAGACWGGGGALDAAGTPGPTPAPGPTTAPTAGVAPASAGPAAFTARGSGRRAQVALTFHTSGDLAIAEQILATLSARRVPITAFLVGQWLEANPSWAKRLTDAGHELANHTYTHPSFATISPDAMRAEIIRTRDLLTRLTGKPGRLFRPSGTGDGTVRPADTVLAAAGAAGYPTVLGFDVDPLDYQSPGATAITQRTLAAATPGAVISLHFGYPDTVAALPGILDGLSARGLTPVTASTLLA